MSAMRQFALVMVLLLFSSPATAGEPGGNRAGSKDPVPVGTEGSERSGHVEAPVDRILTEMDRAYRDLKSYRADFEQESELRSLQKKSLASGKVYFLKPSKMRWSYLRPEPREVYLLGEEIEIYLPDRNQVIIQTLNDAVPGVASARLFMGVQELTRSFSVSLDCPGRPEEDAYCLRLTPKKGQPMSVEEIQLWVGKKDFLPLRTESRDVLGNVTRLSFQNGEANVPLSEELFRFEIPPGAEVIRNSF